MNDLLNGFFEESYKIISDLDLESVSVTYSGNETILRTLAASNYAASVIRRYPEIVPIIIDGVNNKNLNNPFSLFEDLSYNLETLKYEIRRYRHLSLCYIASLTVNEVYSVPETISELSKVADNCLKYAAKWSMNKFNEEYGTSYDSNGNKQEIIIMALGKLGGHELNFSSDVDICFIYPDSDIFEAKKPRASEEDLYLNVARSIVDVISDNNEHGFVYRVDLKLRPFGDSGPVVMSSSAMEEYYQLYGREWERYALIKSRIIYGDPIEGRALMHKLRPFVYRRYMDFSIFESLREMRVMIEQEIKKKDKHDDIKIGRGGIRQIEFIAQSFQLVRGGKDPVFQQRSLLQALEVIKKYKYISGEEHELLVNAYIFLRRVENALQILSDQQVHSLPKLEIDKKRLCVSLGANSWERILIQLNHYRSVVAKIFDKVVKPGENNIYDGPVKVMAGDIWHSINDDKSTLLLKEYMPQEYEPFHNAVLEFHHRINSKKIGQKTRTRINKLMPELINVSLEAYDSVEAICRLISLIESIGRRSLYLSLLIENPNILLLVMELCTKSEWIHQQLCKYPILLDELLEFRHNRGFSYDGFYNELKLRLQWLDKDDLEQQMECLRQFKLNCTFRVAVADVLGEISIKRVSDHLTDIAEVILDSVTDLAFEQIKSKLNIDKDVEYLRSDFAIIAYGKLGGIELSYSSDLDLVFLYDSQIKSIITTRRNITVDSFYMKLGQRIYHLLNTTTTTGPLYNIDMRLRPLGDSGLLVTSLESFSDYQRNSAWTWEHQALVRARVIGSSDKVRRKFKSIRLEILSRHRDSYTLKHDIASMRTRMQKSKRNSDKYFNLVVGGIKDIEFLMQYYVLRWSYIHPILAEPTDNMRIIDSLVAIGVLRSDDADMLRSSYLIYRDIHHKNILYGREQSACDMELLLGRKYAVESIWNNIFASYGGKIIKVGLSITNK
jgi:glutamate-ammonia-ligase adenylyltransferase